MKVVHIVLSNVYAGIEQHVNELIIEQQKNIEVTLICNFEIQDKFNCSRVIPIKNFSRNSLVGLLKFYIVLKKLDIDLIHSHRSKTSSIVNKIRKFLKIKHVATMHGIKKNVSPYMHADKLIVVSSKIQNSIDRDSIKINNWWSPILPKTIDKSNQFVIAIGRLEKVKGFDLLIKSWKNISSNLVIIGSGNEYSYLSELIGKLNLKDKIKIIDQMNQEKLIEYYKKASMLIVSSRNEGGSRVALEALYLKIPVISTDVGHMSEILPNELLAKPNDLGSLSDLVNRYVGNMNYNQDSIFEYVAEEFSLNSKVNQTLEVYNDLLISE